MVDPNPLNIFCSICRIEPPKYLCKCANDALCPDGACLAAHFLKKSLTHVLMPYAAGTGVSREELAPCLAVVDTAMRVSGYVDNEIHWLMERKEEITRGIDNQVEIYIREMREAAEAAKASLDTEICEAVTRVNRLRNPDMRASALLAKDNGQHLETISFTYSRPRADTVFHIAIFSEAKYQLAVSTGGNWRFNDRIDALSFKTSRAVSLTAISLSKGFESTPVLTALEILEGGDLKGRVMYSHDQREILTSDHSFLCTIRLKTEVNIEANRVYTLKAVIVGGQGYRTGPLCLGDQEGLVVTLLPCKFRAEDQNNGTGDKSGIFYEICYRRQD